MQFKSDKFFKKSNYLRVKDGYFRMFIRWAYHKYLDELYIPSNSKITLGHGYEDISKKYNGYGKHVSISSTCGGVRKGYQTITISVP